MPEVSSPLHIIEKALVRGSGRPVLRARCSCGQFSVDAERLSVPARRRQDRLIREHLASVEGPLEAAAMMLRMAIEVAP